MFSLNESDLFLFIFKSFSWFLNVIFDGYRIKDWQLFPFLSIKGSILLHFGFLNFYLKIHKCPYFYSIEESLFPSVWLHLRFISIMIFINFTNRCLNVVFFRFILIGDHIPLLILKYIHYKGFEKFSHILFRYCFFPIYFLLHQSPTGQPVVHVFVLLFKSIDILPYFLYFHLYFFPSILQSFKIWMTFLLKFFSVNFSI